MKFIYLVAYIGTEFSGSWLEFKVKLREFEHVAVIPFCYLVKSDLPLVKFIEQFPDHSFVTVMINNDSWAFIKPGENKSKLYNFLKQNV